MSTQHSSISENIQISIKLGNLDKNLPHFVNPKLILHNLIHAIENLNPFTFWLAKMVWIS